MNTKLSISLLLATVSLNLFANTEAELYCQKQGGKLAPYAQLDSHHRPTGLQKVFCEFLNQDEGFKMINPETLASTTQTTAVRLFRYGLATIPLAMRRGSSPAYTYCTQSLKGTYANWRKISTGDESGTCSFSDGSEMSDWAFVYGAKRLPILNSLMAYQE